MSQTNSNNRNSLPKIIAANHLFGFHSIGFDGEFIQISQTELDWLGYERDEVIGKLRFPDLLTPEHKERFKRRFPLFQQSGIAHDVEYHWISKHGAVVPISVSGTAIRNSSGDFQKSVAVTVNLSQRRQAELAQRQILAKQRQEMVSMLNQDVKDPLLAATRLLEILIRNDAGATTPQQRAIISQLQRTNQVILKQLELMLDTHQKDDAQVCSIEKAPLSSAWMQQRLPLWKVIEGCVLAVTQSDDFIAKNLTFDLDLNESSIIVDTYAFEKVLSHLLRNAAKHSPHLGRISISCTRTERLIELSVRDEGPGIAASAVDNIFAGIAHETHILALKHGLSLPACAKLVEEFGGRLSCSNMPVAGAKFTISIPVQRDS